MIQRNRNGSEYWSARELAIALDYVQWRNFEKVIKRAMIACENSGHNVMDDFAEVSKIVEDGACGNFHILTDDDGIDSDTYKDCLRECNLIEGDYEFDDLICEENGSEWHIRVFIGTDAYWGFFYKCKIEKVCYGK